MVKEERNEKSSYILELLKESGKNGVNARVIDDDCNLSYNQRKTIMGHLMADHPEIKKETVPSGYGRVTTYYWIEKPVELTTHSPFLKNRYEKTNKNSEGYTDMTATAAIANATREPGYIPAPGEIWKAKESDGKTSYIFVVNYMDNAAQCLKLYDVNTVVDAASISYPYRVKIGAITYLGDCSKITPKSKKYLISRARGIKDEELMKVRSDVAHALGIEAFRIEKIEVPGPERIVYKDREPVEVPEGYIDVKDAEIQKLKVQLEAWRSIAWGVINRDKRLEQVAK